jgi:hypothetical protein
MDALKKSSKGACGFEVYSEKKKWDWKMPCVQERTQSSAFESFE